MNIGFFMLSDNVEEFVKIQSKTDLEVQKRFFVKESTEDPVRCLKYLFSFNNNKHPFANPESAEDMNWNLIADKTIKIAD